MENNSLNERLDYLENERLECMRKLSYLLIRDVLSQEQYATIADNINAKYTKMKEASKAMANT